MELQDRSRGLERMSCGSIRIPYGKDQLQNVRTCAQFGVSVASQRQNSDSQRVLECCQYKELFARKACLATRKSALKRKEPLRNVRT